MKLVCKGVSLSAAARLGRWPAVVSTPARLQCGARPAAALPAAGSGDRGGGLCSTHATTPARAPPLMSLTTLPPPSLCTRLPTPPPPPPHIRAQQYLSPQHAKAVSGNNSQGPVYKIYVRGEGRGGGWRFEGWSELVERGERVEAWEGRGEHGHLLPPFPACASPPPPTHRTAPHRTAPTQPLDSRRSASSPSRRCTTLAR